MFDEDGNVDCEASNLAVVECMLESQEAQEPFFVQAFLATSLIGAEEVRLYAHDGAVLEIRTFWKDLGENWPDLHVRPLPEFSECASKTDAASRWQCIVDAIRAEDSLGVCVEQGGAEYDD